MNVRVRLKVINKKRLMFFITLIMFIIIILSVTLFNQTIVSGKTNVEYITVYAESGDTLWSIAEKHNNNQDIRESVFNIIKYNGFETSCLEIGQEIRIPLN